MRPWPDKYKIKPCGSVYHHKRPNVILTPTWHTQHPRPRFGRDGINYDVYQSWFEFYHNYELKDSEYVVAKDDDYSYPFKNPILVTKDTEYFTWKDEIYKRIPMRFDEVPRYFIHEDSRLISLNNRRVKSVKSHPMGNRGKYLQHTIVTRNNPKVPILVHRLVAETYLGNIDCLQVDHIDTNTHNNRLENLQIVTGAENIWLRDSRNDRFFDGKINKAFGWDTELPEVALDICWD